MNREKKIVLVSCVKKKAGKARPAEDLYASLWFDKARSLVKRSGLPWFILSAKHGLLRPDDVIEPYERALKKMPVHERRAWAGRVRRQMEDILPDADEVVIFAGERYRESLMGYLHCRFQKVSIPMERLQIGQQLKWLKNAPLL